jgi:Mg-chelatase subunit ChlD
VRFTNPAGLWLAALAIPVVLLHVLRPRRPPVEVSSTYLWRELADPVSVASPWQRLKPSLLLLVQLLAVLLLAVAAARPVRVTEAPLARHSVFIVDASGSMAAEDGRPDRVGAAVSRARDLRAQLPAGGVASVVVADSQPRVVLSSSPDRRAFDEAVGAIRTTPGGADFATAFTLAESLETPGEPVGFILLSDGGLTDVEKGLLPPGTRYVRTGSEATNRAVSRLTVEPRGSGLHARVTVRNTGGPSATQTLRIDVDGRTAHSERVVLDAGTAVEREVDLPSGDRIEAFLEGEDLLAADNRAVAVAGHRRALRVLWAGPDDVFLERLLAVLPSLAVERAPDSRPAPGFDLAIYAGVAVPADPGVPYIAIAPPGGAPGVRVTGEVPTPAVTLVRTTNQLLAGLDLSDVAVAKAQRIEAPGDEVLVGSEATPLLLRGNRQGTPFAYLGFNLSQSNLPVQVAFPVLADRLLTDLTGSGAPPSDLRVGQTLPLALAEGATVEAPGGARLTVPPGGAPPVLDRVGFWTITRPTANAAPVTVAVNADPAESTLAPAGSLPAPARPTAPGERKPAGERSLLAWIAAALAVLLLSEWILSRRRRGVARRQWAMAMATRVAVGALVVAAVAGLSVPRPGRHVAVVFLVDGSDSLGAAGRTQAVEWTRRALSSQPKGAEAGVAVFGGDARLELTVQSRARLLQPSVRIDSSRTNLAGALRLAAAVLPSDARRRIVVVSDGKATEGDAAAEARRLRDAGIEVDVHLVESSGGPDVAIERVDAPSTVRQGEAYTVRATIQSSHAQTVRLRWERDSQVIDERLVDVNAGSTVVDLPQVATEPGSLARYHLTVTAADDAVVENDVGDAAVATEGPPRVLLVEGMPGQGATLAAALRAGGIPTDVIAATDVPPVDRLAGYSSTVLVDVDARALVADQVSALAAASRDLGRGLVVVGGDRSFALGGYLGSELEKVLPVVSDVTDPKRRPSVAQVLAIDSSGSMGACHCAEGGANGLVVGNSAGGVNKTDISRAAAARTISALSNNDQVGVLAFNTQHNWVVPLQQLPPEDVVTKGLSGLSPAGGTNLTLPLKEAGDALRKAKAGLKHIILFTDGFTSHGGLDTLADQAAALAQEGITVSVLATGETGARDNLAHVAEAGRGRFYNEVDLSQVPQLMMQEAVLASRQLVNEGEYYPTVTSSAPAVRDLRQSPPLLGYLVTTAKPSAQTHLSIGEEDDPLLASWQIGLGKVTAWTSDAGTRWSQQWAAWPGFRDFWSTVVKDTFPLTGASGAGVRVTVDGSKVRIVAESAEPWPDGATATARLTGPDLVGRDVPLERVSGTTFVGEAAATAAGTYAAGVSVTGPGGPLLSATGTGVQAYSAEYRPGPADPDALERVSDLSGGRGAIAPEQAFASEGLRAGRGRIPLAGWFLLAAALLWPVAVALSRVALHGAAVAALRSGRGRVVEAVRRRLPRIGSPPSSTTPAPPRRPGPERDQRPVKTKTKTKTPAAVAAPPPTIDRLLKRKRGESEDLP